MRKFATFITVAIASLCITGNVLADTPNLSVQISQPKSPTNNNDIKLTVVTLDRTGATISIQCMKKGPGEGVFSQFGSTLTVNPGGGNSVICETPTSLFGTEGNYNFAAIASNGTDPSVTSNVVTVNYLTSGPGTPSYIGKDRVNVCDYKVKFHTADDSGKTIKVEVYRSENTTFDANVGSRVDSLTIGSNTDGSSTTTPPSCDKEYYFAIRAFDIAGNGSGIAGDSVVHITNTTTTTQTGSSGVAGEAIPAGTAGNVLGEATGPTGFATGAGGSVLGSSPSASPTPPSYIPPSPKPISGKTIIILGAIVILLMIAWAMRKKSNVV
jgi:hypothetical protein